MNDHPSQSANESPSDDNAPVSKSARKREMAALQTLGESLLDLSADRFAKLPLSSGLREALNLAKSLKQREARRRQLQYVGKLMRAENYGEISAALTRFEDDNRLFRQRFKRLEKIRDELIEDSGEALEALLNSHPQLDRQHLRQLIRQAKKASLGEDDAQNTVATDKATAKRRKLFEYLRETIVLG